MEKDDYSLVFVSNYFNHHQKPLSDALYALTKGNYSFITTGEMSSEREKLGYCRYYSVDYVLQYNDAREKCDDLIARATVLIIGSAPDELIKERLRNGKLTFRYSERLYKAGFQWKNFLRNMISAWIHHGRYQRYPLYMLCASGFTSADCARFGNYKGRCFKWGYFPETKRYENLQLILSSKKKNSILWVGRLIPLKHPDDVITVARCLKERGYSFEINMIGSGEMEKQLRAMLTEFDLNDCVHLLGAMKPNEVRQYMEQSGIFLFTSDKNEGWGAVLNEAMNSACAVIASHSIGSVPFLVRHNENGLVFKQQDTNMLRCHTEYLLEHPKVQERLGRKAYVSIQKEWNAEVAAERFIQLTQSTEKKVNGTIFDDGPCSKAGLIKDDWFIDEKYS